MKVTRNNYREYYKKYFNIELDSKFEVHHIDGNRDNNKINNLLLLPSQTHFNFHQTSRFFSTFKEVSPDLIRLQKSSTYDIEQLEIYISAICEIKRFFDYKRCFYIVSPTGVKKNRLK